MTLYHQSDSLSLTTSVPLSGTGSSTPEAAATNTDYSGWSWETILATVLNVDIPDRSELSGQPWLTITHDGATIPGAHQIWTASWDTSPNSGSSSITVYLNPSLYTNDGVWEQFAETPAAALSGVPAGNLGPLVLQPSSFQAAGQAVSGASAWFGSAAQELSQLAQQVPPSGEELSGSSAQVINELFSKLGTVTLSLQEQMTRPVSYSDAIQQAGGAATQFLSSLWSAYSGWTGQLAYSPLGALVQVLQDIAGPGAGGEVVIANPQDTTYGDLTTDQAWSTVEQQAKNAWLGLLTDGTAGFGGLDPLGRAAISALVSEYDSAITTLAPVVGPAASVNQPNPVGLGGNPGGSGGTGGSGPGRGSPNDPGNTAKGTLFNVGGGPASGGTSAGTGGPGGLGGAALLLAPGGPAAGGPGTGGSGNGVQGNGGQTEGGPSPAAEAAGTAGPIGGLAADIDTSPGSANAPVADPGEGTALLSADSALLGGSTVNGALAGGAGAGDGQGPVALSGAIGALADADAQDEAALLASADSTAFTGTIGRTGESDQSSAESSRKRAMVAVFAPAAGSALGRSPDGSVLTQSTVPALQAAPPSVRSGPVNTQLVPDSGTGAGTSAGIGLPEGEGAAGLADGPLLMPRSGALGGLGGLGAGSGESQRMAYLPEGKESWGTDPEAPGVSIGAPGRTRPLAADSTETPEYIPRIGAIGQPAGRRS
jgi:hypothetical protein